MDVIAFVLAMYCLRLILDLKRTETDRYLRMKNGLIKTIEKTYETVAEKLNEQENQKVENFKSRRN